MDHIEKYSGEIAWGSDKSSSIPDYKDGALPDTPEMVASRMVQPTLAKMILAQTAPGRGFDAATHVLRLRPVPGGPAGSQRYEVYAMPNVGFTYVLLGGIEAKAADVADVNARLRSAFLTGGR